MIDLMHVVEQHGRGIGRWDADLRPFAVARVVLLTLLLVGAGSTPAHAQRLGRRFRPQPSVPRAPSPAPARPTPGAVAPGAPPARAPAPAAGPKAGGTPSKDKPQTTSAPARRQGVPKTAEPARPAAEASIAAADTAWDGEVPFGPAWRRRHPAAWNADAESGGVLLTGATDTPTRVDRPAAVAAEARTARSVLSASEREPELLVFPAESTASDGAAVTPAADGTVSVLARDGGSERDRPSGVAPAAGEGIVVAGGDEPRGSPWLPLGAFAAVPEGYAAESVPHVFLELSLHRDGTVRGNYYDALSDAVQPVTGRVDREAGTLAWRVGSGPEFRAEADGLAAGRARVTVRKGSTERVWTLIALD